jgi:metallo-beta-lactamase class B
VLSARGFAFALIAAALGLASCREASEAAGDPLKQALERQYQEWTRPHPPFRIVGNVYWVGSHDLATYLITTPHGHILINSGVGDTADRIEEGVDELGFELRDVKILTLTHGHFDHVAGIAELQRRSGAELVVSEGDRELLESGGSKDFRFGDMPEARFEPVLVDRTFRDGETISLGGTVLTAHHHPGHTKGATSFTLDVAEGGKTRRVLIANMATINPGVRVSGMPTYPEIGADYARTFAAQKVMQIDVWLASHASQFAMHEKHAPGDAYDPERFVDPEGFRRAVEALEKAYLEQLAREQAGG